MRLTFRNTLFTHATMSFVPAWPRLDVLAKLQLG